MRTLLSGIGAVLFVVAFLLALVLTNVRMLVFDADYYMRGYQVHGGASTTRMTEAELAEATAQIQSYFQGGPPISIVVDKEWGREVLFNDREQQHLADVRDLLNLTLRVQEASLAYLALAATLLVLVRRGAGARSLARWVTAGSVFTLALFALIGILAIGDFSAFWTQFHLLSFSNDLWLLDPRTDYMIRLYPITFWFQAVFDIIIRSALVAIALLFLAQVYLRLTAGQRVGAAASG
jgi:integral membrane protein (TIGR01906 family)